MKLNYIEWNHKKYTYSRLHTKHHLIQSLISMSRTFFTPLPDSFSETTLLTQLLLNKVNQNQTLKMNLKIWNKVSCMQKICYRRNFKILYVSEVSLWSYGSHKMGVRSHEYTFTSFDNHGRKSVTWLHILDPDPWRDHPGCPSPQPRTSTASHQNTVNEQCIPTFAEQTHLTITNSKLKGFRPPFAWVQILLPALLTNFCQGRTNKPNFNILWP